MPLEDPMVQQILVGRESIESPRLCLEFINVLLELLKGLALRLTLSCKSPFRDQNQKGSRDEC